MMAVLKHMCIYFKWNLIIIKYLQLTAKVYPCCSYQIATAKKDLVMWAGEEMGIYSMKRE